MEKEKTNPDQLNILIEQKRRRLPENVVVLKPEAINPHMAAEDMTTILSAVYGQHNLMPSIAQLEKQIAAKRILPWFLNENGKAIACTALIINEDSVEIGRAANHPQFGHNGSLLMLEAVTFHRKNHQCPLVAEIRLADDFLNIPGGQGSQATLIKNAGIMPHAIMPAFHHPGPDGPDRQEFFCFSVEPKPSPQTNIFMPQSVWQFSIIRCLKDILLPFAEITFVSKQKEVSTGFRINTNPPFNILEPFQDGDSLKQTMREAGKPFTLAPIPLTVQTAPIADFLLNNGFIPCGFDWKTPTLFLGKLKSGVVLAPIGLASDCFQPEMEKAILELEQQFNQQIKTL